MKIVSAEEIRACLEIKDLVEPVAQAFRDYSRGCSSDAVAHLFPSGGDRVMCRKPATRANHAATAR